MDWKKLIDSRELIVIEGNYKGNRIKIEARLNEKNEWSLYEIRIRGDNSDLIKEFNFKTRSDVIRTIQRLLSEKNPLKSNVYRRAPRIELKRLFKEELVEKWGFIIANEKISNFIYIIYGESIKADVVIHTKYKSLERFILSVIEEKLSLKDFSDEIIYDVFYYKESNHNHFSNRGTGEAIVSDIYIQFGIDKGED
jgi:hypothetical protein